jgi:hypothetical protein
VWVIGGGVGVIGGGGVRRTSLACRDPTQPRFGHISSCKPHSDYLSVPDVRQKCYKIPPENELCLCEDIFQQHQAKLVNCDVEDASAVESYKEPSFESNENTYDDSGSNECCCVGDKDGDKSPKLSLLSPGDRGLCDDRKSSLVSSVTSTASTSSSSSSADLAVVPVDNRQLSEKLTAEERDKVLKELDDIITGNFLTKVRRFSQDVQSDSSDDHRGGVNQLQLTHVAATRLRGKRSSSLDTDEIVNYGKVAELTRRFSRLGEAGIIGSQHYCSEPNFFGDPSSARHYHRHCDNDDDSSLSFGVGGGDGDGVACSSGDDYEVVRQPIRMVFIRPMSVSDDRLNNRNVGGAVLTEVTSDGENDVRRTLNAAQNRRRSFRKSVAFDSSLSSSIDGGSGDEAATRYRRLKGGWQSVSNQQQDHHRTSVNYSKSSDTVSMSNLGRSHRRYSSVDVYDQVKNMFLDVEKTEKEFRDGLLAEKNRRREAIQEYMANKELLLIKMKSASVGGILRWNQEHQDTLLDDEEPLAPSPPPMLLQPPLIQDRRSSSSSEEGSPKDGLRRVLHTGLKGRRIRRLRKLESRSNGFSVADFWRVSKDELPSSSRHSTGCSSAEPLDKHNNML